MGRKGGGRAGFMKAARHGPDSEDEVQEEAQPAKPAAAAPSPSKTAQGSSKAHKFLKEEPAAGGASSDEEPERREGGETRGQVVQRHKREHKALKDQLKRLGKKAKEEGVQLEEEMNKRHAAELAAFDAPKADTAEAVALAGSLYSVSLAGDEEHKKEKKPTKSQKKREQRAQKDAEREARIAAELAELGDTDRVLEERALKQLLRPLGLAIRDIPPDGHCLYRSLEDQLAQCAASCTQGGDEVEGGAASFLELRQRAAEYMRQHADHFMPFVLEAGDGADGTAEAFEAYCSQVEMTAAWGGQPELQALAQALKAHILVYSSGMPVLDIGEEFKDTGKTLRLCYLRHAFGLGEHYNSVQPGIMVEDGEEEAAGDAEGDSS